MLAVGDLVLYPKNLNEQVIMTVVKVTSDDPYQICDLLGVDGTLIKEIWIGCLQIISEQRHSLKNHQ